MVSAPARKPDITRVIFESIFKVPKLSFRGKGMNCRDPEKVDIFQNFDNFNYAYIRRPRMIRSSLQPS